MGMTMTQKILAAHAGLGSVRAGQLIQAKLDLVLGNDITTPVAINEFEAAGFQQVFDKSRIALVMDHFAPNKDIKAATQCKQCRTFARRFDIHHYYDVGEMGIEHALLPEKGLVAPGKDVILTLIGMIGVDGARYQSLEFAGDGVANLTMFDRLTISNMAIEAGAKNGIFPVDDVTRAYVAGRVDREWTAYEADLDAEYERVIAATFARIFYRNAINIGLAILECPAAAAGIDAGDEVAVDFDTGIITNVTKGETYQSEPFPPFIKEMIAKGGLMASLASKEA